MHHDSSSSSSRRGPRDGQEISFDHPPLASRRERADPLAYCQLSSRSAAMQEARLGHLGVWARQNRPAASDSDRPAAVRTSRSFFFFCLPRSFQPPQALDRHTCWDNWTTGQDMEIFSPALRSPTSVRPCSPLPSPVNKNRKIGRGKQDVDDDHGKPLNCSPQKFLHMTKVCGYRKSTWTSLRRKCSSPTQNTIP